MKSTKLCKNSEEEPPCLKEDATLSFKSIALFFISVPSSSTMSLLIAFSIFPLSTPSSNCMPILQTWLTNLAFTLWSPTIGEHSIGTPSLILSTVEFHPLCVQNPPTDRCANTASWGAQLMTLPLLFVVSLNSFGKSWAALDEPLTKPGRTTHRKGWPLLARPQAISTSSLSLVVIRLPMLT